MLAAGYPQWPWISVDMVYVSLSMVSPGTSTKGGTEEEYLVVKRLKLYIRRGFSPEPHEF